MTVEEFVSTLRSLKPNVETLAKNGFSKEQISQIQRSFECTLIHRSRSLETNILLELLTNYDCSNVEIGLVKFAKNVEEYIDYYIIGEVEADILTLNKITLEVMVLDHDDQKYVIWECASNGENFLSALLEFSRYTHAKLDQNFVTEGNDFTRTWLQKCVQKAGGDKYIEFYKMLLGFYDEA